MTNVIREETTSTVWVAGQSNYEYVEDGVTRRATSRSGGMEATPENIAKMREFMEADRNLRSDITGISWTYRLVIETTTTITTEEDIT